MCFYVQMYFLVVTTRINDLLNSFKVKRHKACIIIRNSSIVTTKGNTAVDNVVPQQECQI